VSSVVVDGIVDDLGDGLFARTITVRRSDSVRREDVAELVETARSGTVAADRITL